MSNQIATNFTPLTDSDPHGESLGAWLAQIRAGYGIEQRDAARHLKLNAAIIQALEADDFARLGPPVFVRGYLSRYAQLLNLSEPEVLERYRRQSDAGQSQIPPLKVVHPVRRQTRVRDLRGLFYLLVVGGIGWAAVQHLHDLDPSRLTALWSGDPQKDSGQTVVAPATATTQVQYPFQPKPAETTNEPPAQKPAPPASDPSPARPDPDPGSAIAAAPAPAASLAVSAPAPILSVSGVGTTTVTPTLSMTESTSDTGTEAKLLLEFSNDCWVEVKDAQGNVLASGLMKANTTRALSGPIPFKVTLGNAPAARLILDDRLVNTAVYVPRRGTVSRFTLDRGQP